MKTRIKQNNKFNASKNPLRGKPRYYFHADEDFREDWNWGKTEPQELSKHTRTSGETITNAIV